MKLQEVTLRTVRLPLISPYVLSYRTFTEFDPIIVEVRDGDGRVGWGEGHISPGSSRETREGGWSFCREAAGAVVGLDSVQAKSIILARADASRVAATAIVSAIEMLEDDPLLEVAATVELPILTPLNGKVAREIEAEVERRLTEGFRTFKVKVGMEVSSDLARLKSVQQALNGRATIRLDANRAYSQADACRFAEALDPTGVELFEQPCETDDWDANAEVAKRSPVPLMLDEPICSIGDIERAGRMANVGFCKLKLKRFGGLERLKLALDKVRELGMEPVLGDGLSSEIGCWMEACVASRTIRNAGEFNGFLKPRVRLFGEPLRFAGGAVKLPAGFMPTIDMAVLAKHETDRERFAVARVPIDHV